MVCFQAEYQDCFCSGLRGHLLYSVLPQQPPQLFQISLHVERKLLFCVTWSPWFISIFLPDTLQLGQLQASIAVYFADRYCRWENYIQNCFSIYRRPNSLTWNCSWNISCHGQKEKKRNYSCAQRKTSQCIGYKINFMNPICTQMAVFCVL